MTATTPYGWWPSPLHPATAAAARSSRSQVSSDGEHLYWLESRPAEGGRVVLVRDGADGAVEVSPAGANIRSRVHEYGGGAACLLDGGRVAYVEASDQRIYRAPIGGGAPQPLTGLPPAGERWHHGDLHPGPAATVLAVRERHREGGVVRQLVAVAVAEPAPATVLVEGRHFLTAPRPSPDGSRLAWLAWDHPAMPWDAAELWVASLGSEAGPLGVTGAHRLAGGEGSSAGQPTWGADGALRFVDDVEGWWQPWRWDPGPGRRRRLSDLAAEFHGPDWVLGQSTLAVLGSGRLACRWRRDAVDRVAVLDEATGALEPIDQPCVTVTALVAHGDGLAWLGRTPYAPAGPWIARPGVRPAPVLAEDPPLDPGHVSVGEPFTGDAGGGRGVHGLFFAPRLAGTEGPGGERPPLVLCCHAGPTGSIEAGFDLVTQFLTTRGFAVAWVDYAGSTGYGRPYRESLYGRWGEVDSDDVLAAARHLAGAGRVDGARMAARGASAGGLTALNALVRGRDLAGAVSWYGVTDLLALDAATHDFEASYNARLVGPRPEADETYRRRSPVERAADIEGAVLLLAGTDDPVVPAAQAESMAAALAARGRRCELVLFEGEGHGFRRAETVVACLQAELAFYRDLLTASSVTP